VVTIISPAKTAEVIASQFGLWARVGTRRNATDGLDIPTEMNVLRIGNVPSHCPLKSIDRFRSANGGDDAGCRDYFSSNLSIFPGEHAPHCPSGVPAFDGRRLATATFKGKSSVRPCQKVTRDYNTDRIKITINGMLWHTTCCAPSHFQGNGASQTPPPTTLAPYDMPPWGPLWEKTRRHPQNRKYKTYRNATGEGPSTATGSMHRKCDEVWTYGF